jgi:hypothetical protein
MAGQGIPEENGGSRLPSLLSDSQGNGEAEVLLTVASQARSRKKNLFQLLIYALADFLKVARPAP